MQQKHAISFQLDLKIVILTISLTGSIYLEVLDTSILAAMFHTVFTTCILFPREEYRKADATLKTIFKDIFQMIHLANTYLLQTHICEALWC